MRKSFIFICIILFSSVGLIAQEKLSSELRSISYSAPRTFEIGGITVSGVKFLDAGILINLSGLTVGMEIEVPGMEITTAIEKLWEQELFSDVRISATRIIGNKIFLDIYLQEMPRMSKFLLKGVNRTEAEDIREKINLSVGNQITENVLNNIEFIIKNHFINKGFLNTQVDIYQQNDTTLVNSVVLDIHINKNKRVKIFEIFFKGNEKVQENKLRKAMKDTKRKTWYNIFKASKFVESNFIADKENLINYYRTLGFRDARVLKDSISKNEDGTINLHIDLYEGKQYYFRNITWSGNKKFTSKALGEELGIEKGDIFDESVLAKRLTEDMNSIQTLYMDQGYLYYQANPVELMVDGDSIDFEIQLYEGEVARIGRVIINGNDKTHEHVVRRELRTVPGDLFSKTKLMRSARELAQLGHFDPEQINPVPTPNDDGTVDIVYNLVERANDQIELSGGWGANMIVGTLGVRFSNFSTRNIFKKEAWRPLPSGDGQTLSVRAQSNGKYYQSYNLSFIEPWLGGKKPNSFSVSMYHTVQSNGRQVDDPARTHMKISGVSLGLGRRLSWPDDYFTLQNELSYMKYNLKDWTYYNFLINNGDANTFAFKTRFGRNSTDQIIFPRTGSSFDLSLAVTPPYSAFSDKDYSTMTSEQKFKWIEYHKWKFKGSWYNQLFNNFVMATKAEFGYLGYYNENLRSPFEGFYVGGDGIVGYNLYGRETIALRGYSNGSLTPANGANIYNKLTFELRYLISPNPNSTIYALVFLEGGNAWYDFKEFNPFKINRSAGVGVRIFLPMFGLMGVDWGYGFDETIHDPGNGKSQFHFVLGPQL